MPPPPPPPCDPALIAEVVAAMDEGRAPDLSLGGPYKWTGVLNELFVTGRLEQLEFISRRLFAHYQNFTYARNLCALFDRIPPADDSQTQFRDDLTREVQVARREGSDAVIIAFCGGAMGLGMPLSAMHRWFGRLPASVIYLRDFRSLFYFEGLPSLGPTRDATLEALRILVGRLGGRRLFCCGTSGGVFASLHYGLDLGAEHVVGFAGAINFSLDFNAHLRSGGKIRELWKKLPYRPIDLKQLYVAAKNPPRVHLIFGSDNWDDRLHAEYMSGLPTVTMQSVPGFGEHNIAFQLIRERKFEPLLEWFVGMRPEVPGLAAAVPAADQVSS